MQGAEAFSVPIPSLPEATTTMALPCPPSLSAAAACLLVAAGATFAARMKASSSVRRRRAKGGSTARCARVAAIAPENKVEIREGCDDDVDEVVRAKSDLMRALRSDRLPDGSSLPADHPAVSVPLDALRESYARSGVDARTCSFAGASMDGDYLMEHSPSFIGKLGHNSSGDPLFTLGRMTFSMIRPTDAVCSLQRVTQHVHRLGRTETLPEKIPPKLRDAVEANAGELRTFVTRMYFTVENDDDRKGGRGDASSGHMDEKKDDQVPLSSASSTSSSSPPRGPRGVMRMDGYCFPDPTEPNRLAVWFSGGKCSPQDGEDHNLWLSVFGRHLPARPLSERLTLLAAKTFIGAVPLEGLDPLDGVSVRFELRRPIAAYQDVAYVDDDLRVTVGNKGTVVICSRLNGIARKNSMLR